MPRVYDNWERLVKAVLDREKLRYLALCDSFSSLDTPGSSSHSSFDSLHVPGVGNLATSSSAGQSRPPDDISDDYENTCFGSINQYLFWLNRSIPVLAQYDFGLIKAAQYDFGLIKAATDGFSEVNTLGQGGFGLVYKGKLPNGQEVAVRRLSSGSSQGDLEFKNEVMLLVKLQHRNLVRLFGFSIEGPEKLLVYEFMENAGLDQLLFDPTKRSLLDWSTRYKIIGGIARGILYLHEDSRLTIIHRDLKASNVLLDGDLNPKIADFGMARLFVPDETRGSTSRIVGTHGYMAPEYAIQGHFSVKSDVFSFGVLLLEMISGQRNYCFQHGETKEDLISSAWRNWHEGTAANLVDPVLKVGSSIGRDIFRCIHIGLLCVQENAIDRPTMASVILMLNSFSITLPLPSHSAFSSFSVRDDYSSESSLLQVFTEEEGNFNRSVKNMGAESGNSFIKRV